MLYGILDCILEQKKETNGKADEIQIKPVVELTVMY